MDDVSLLTHGINASNSNGITTNTDWQQIIREYEAEYGQEAESIDAMMPELVGQLVHGCGTDSCRASHCATGIRNTTKTPVRNYTPRSARIIALELLEKPDPRAYICQHFDLDSRHTQSAIEEGPRDPSSIGQQMVETSVLKLLARGEGTETGVDPAGNMLHCRVAAMSRKLHSLCERPLDASGAPNPRAAPMHVVADTVASALELCYDFLPGNYRSEHWQSLAHCVNTGQALPPRLPGKPPHDAGMVALLEVFNFEPFVRLCSEICRVVAFHMHVQLVFMKITGHDVGDLEISRLISDRLNRIARSRTNDNTNAWVPWPYSLWFKKVFVKHWDGKPIVKRGTVACGALELLRIQQCIWDRSNPDKATEANLLPFVYKRLDPIEVALTWMGHDPDKITHSRHLLSFSFLYTTGQVLVYSRMINHLRMSDVNKQSNVSEELYDRWIAPSDAASLEWDNRIGQVKHLRDFYLLVDVRRDHVVQDAFDQIWQRHRREIARPLRVRLGEMEGAEIGQDLGGVQIEFFNLVCKQLFAEDTGMFTTDPISSLSYFRPGSLQPLYMFELFGLLVGLAMYNGITIPVNFPHALYKQMLDLPCEALLDLQDGWPEITRSLQAMKDGAHEGLDYVFPLEANGLRLSINDTTLASIRSQVGEDADRERNAIAITPYEASAIDMSAFSHKDLDTFSTENTTWPGWTINLPSTDEQTSSQKGIIPENENERDQLTLALNPDNIQDYIADYTAWLTRLSVQPQLAAFLSGFHEIMPRSTIAFFIPRTLKAALEGTSTLDIRALRRTTQYAGYRADEPYMQTFWRVVEAWTPAKQKALLKFVTAAERVPVTGAGALTFKIHESEEVGDEGMLPTSSTCFGTLYLPRYKDQETLERKLGIALEFGGVGFGNG